jgi:hypothetical protein
LPSAVTEHTTHLEETDGEEGGDNVCGRDGGQYGDERTRRKDNDAPARKCADQKAARRRGSSCLVK